MIRPSQEADRKIDAAWARYTLTNDGKDFYAYIDLLISMLSSGRLCDDNEGLQPILPSDFLHFASQQLHDIDSRFEMPACLRRHHATTPNACVLSIMQKSIDVIIRKYIADEKLICIVVVSCTYFERVYDPNFRWKRKLARTELFRHATHDNNNFTGFNDCDDADLSAGGDGGDTPSNKSVIYSYPSNTMAAKPGQLRPVILPLLLEMLMKIPDLFDEAVLSRPTYEHITTCALHLLGSILYGSVYNAQQAATPAVLDALLWLLKHRLKIVDKSCERDELIVIDLLCLTRMVHVLHNAPVSAIDDAESRLLEVDALLEEYFRFISNLPDADGSQRLKQMLLDQITVILNYPNRHSLQRIMITQCDAFDIIKAELCRFSRNLSLPSNNSIQELSMSAEKSFDSSKRSAKLCTEDADSNQVLCRLCAEKADTSQFVLAKLIRIVTQLIRHSDYAKEAFDVEIGFTFLLKILLKLHPLNEEVVHAVVDMLFEDLSDDVDQQLRRLENPKATVLFISLLPSVANVDLLWAVEQLFHHAQSSISYRAFFVETGMLSTILSILDQNLPRQISVPKDIVDLLHRFATLLAEFSLNSSELSQILHCLQQTATSSTQANFLLKCLKKVSSTVPPKPPTFFDIRREFDGLFINNFGKLLSTNNSFAFHCWLCIDKFQQPKNARKKIRRTLFCFTEENGAGFEAFFCFPGDDLCIVYRTRQKYLVIPVRFGKSTMSLASDSNEPNATTLCDGRWHSLTISYNMAASISTLRKRSNKLLGLTSSIASSLATAAATTVSVYVDGNSVLEDAVVISKSNKSSKMPQTFSRCMVGAATPTSDEVVSVNAVDPKRDKTITNHKSLAISIPLGAQDDIWGTPLALYGLLGPVCFFPDVLSASLVKLLHDDGPNGRGLSRNTMDIAVLNRFYINFSPHACEQISVDLEPYFNGVEDNWLELEPKNCINLASGAGHATFRGHVQRLASIHDSIGKIGGVTSFLSLVENCDYDKSYEPDANNVEKFGESCDGGAKEARKGDESYDTNNVEVLRSGENCNASSMDGTKHDQNDNAVACFFIILRNILTNRDAVDSNVVFDNPTGIFGTFAVLLADKKPKHKIFSMDVLFAVQTMTEFLLFEFAKQHPNPLCADFLEHILFNFDLWYNLADYAVQIEHTQFIRKIVRDQDLFCRHYGVSVQFLLDIGRKYYLPHDLNPIQVSHESSHNNFAAIPANHLKADIDDFATQASHTLSNDNARAVRANIFLIMRDIMSRDTTRGDDVRALIAFMLSVVNSAPEVVEELIHLCSDMVSQSRNLSDQFALHMCAQDNAELLYHIVTLKSTESTHNNAFSKLLLDSSRSESTTVTIELDSNCDDKPTGSINRFSSVKQKVLQFIDLLLATPKVHEKSKALLRLEGAGGLMGLTMFFNDNNNIADLDESVLLMLVDQQILQFQESISELECEACYANLLALANKLHYVTRIETKLEIARRFLSLLFMRPRAAHQLSRISGWCVSLLGLLVEEPIRAGSTATISVKETTTDFFGFDKSADSVSLPSTSPSSIAEFPLYADDEPFQIVLEEQFTNTTAVLSNSLQSKQLGSRSMLSLPRMRHSSESKSITTQKKFFDSRESAAPLYDSPRNSHQHSKASSELAAIVVNIIFTGIWKGVDGFDRVAWLKRAQAFTSIDIVAQTNLLYTSRQNVKRAVLEMLLTAVTMDVQNLTPAMKPNYTAVLENTLSVLKLCFDFCCNTSLILDVTFVEKFLFLCEIVLSFPKSSAKNQIVDRLDLVSMHRAVLLQCISSESLELVEFGATRLHAIIIANEGVAAALKIKEAEEAAYLLHELHQRIVDDFEMGANSQRRSSICAVLWKNLLRQCGAMLGAEAYLLKVLWLLESESEEHENLLELKSFLLSGTPADEWQAFMNSVETSHGKFKVKYVDDRRERLNAFWNECYALTVDGLHARNRQYGEAELRCHVRIMRRAVRRQREEQNRFNLTLKRHDDELDVIRRRKRYLATPTTAKDSFTGYELKPYENSLRIRPCVEKCWNFNRNLFDEAAKLRDKITTLTGSQRSPVSTDQQQILLRQASSLAKNNGLKFDDADEDWDVIISASAAEREITENADHTFYGSEEHLLVSSPSQVTGSNLVYYVNCTRVTAAFVVDGIFQLTSDAIRFTPSPPSAAVGNNWTTYVSNKLIAPEEMPLCVRLDALKELHLRKYNLRRSAVEFFLTNQTNFFFNFADVASRNMVCSRIISLKPPNMVYYKARSPAALLKASGITQRWVQREIGNFEYLMELNTIAGRTFNDLAQYPVFPWVVKKFNVDVLDLEDPDTFRDLSRPMGVQNPALDAEVRTKYEGFDDPDTPAFHYGQHYSTPATVMHYLVRLEPFSSLHVALQSGRWDLADRQFHDIALTWKLLYENSNEVKELIPEFFSLPEFLTNINQYNFGCLQGGNATTTLQVGDVVLPRWARTPEEFIYRHRRALECDYVSARLHHWIDLVFGYKQRGPAAVDALNMFYYCTYEGNVDLDAIQDPIERRALEGMINNFGQTPSQLLQEPHPRRMTREEAVRRALKSSSDRNLSLINDLQHLRLRVANVQVADDACVYVGLAGSSSSSSSLLSAAAVPALPNPSRNLFVQTITIGGGETVFPVVTVGASGAVGTHIWQPSTNSSNSGLWETDMNSTRNKTARNIAGPFHPLFSSSRSSGSEKSANNRMRRLNSNLFVLSVDGKFLISAGHWDKSIRVFNINRNKTISHLSQHRDVVTAIGIDTFGLHLISGSRDGAVCIWNTSNIFQQQDLVGVEQSGSAAATMTASESHKTPLLRSLIGHVVGGVAAVAINTEFDMALSAGDDNTIIMSGVEHGEYKRTLRPFVDFPEPKDGAAKRQVKTGQVEFVCISSQTAHIYVAANYVTFGQAEEYDETQGESMDETETFCSILFVYSINGKFLYHRTFSSDDDGERGVATTQKSDFTITCLKCAPYAEYCLVAVEESNVKHERVLRKSRQGTASSRQHTAHASSFVVSSSTQNVLYVIEWLSLNIVASVPLAARGLSMEVARGSAHILVGMQNGQVAIVSAYHLDLNAASLAESKKNKSLSPKPVSRSNNSLNLLTTDNARPISAPHQMWRSGFPNDDSQSRQPSGFVSNLV